MMIMWQEEWLLRGLVRGHQIENSLILYYIYMGGVCARY